MKRKINPNYKFLRQSYTNQKWEEDEEGTPKLVSGFQGVALEGSSRSGKTISSIDFIIWLCATADTPLVILVVKETLVSFETTLNNDFSNRLNAFGLFNPFQDTKKPTEFKILGSKISFLGADKPSKFDGAGSDFVYINEALPIAQIIFDNLEMRCKKFWWMDYNPKVTEHWVFNSVTGRGDVGFLRTTWRDNPFISRGEKNKVLRYSPYAVEENVYVENNELYFNGEPISDSNQPKPHPTNIEEGTADMTNYKVLSHGIRCAPEGLIFQHIKYIDEWPEGLAHIYGNDFGFTVDPNALVKFGQDGDSIYLELLGYEPIADPDTLDRFFESLGIGKREMIVADSSDKYTSENKGTVEMVYMMRDRGWEMFKIRKIRSIMVGLNEMKSKKIHIIKNHLYEKAKIEAENYKLKEINGIRIEQPDDKCKDHFWDAARYCYMAFNWDM